MSIYFVLLEYMHSNAYRHRPEWEKNTAFICKAGIQSADLATSDKGNSQF